MSDLAHRESVQIVLASSRMSRRPDDILPAAASGVLLGRVWRYLKSHERFINDALAQPGGGLSMAELKDFHERQLRYVQHERLIHLIVTLFVCTYLLLIIGFIAVHPIWPAFALAALLFALVCAYVVHYFRLENGVQRWYLLANQIEERLGRVSQRYEL